jgi:hypothetical protein
MLVVHVGMYAIDIILLSVTTSLLFFAQNAKNKKIVYVNERIGVKSVIPENQTYVVETITMTRTITEHRIIETAEETEQPPVPPPKAATLQPPALPEGRSSVYASSQSVEAMKNDLNATIIPKFNVNGTAQAITGILKGGKLRKTDSVQVHIFIYLFI